MLLFTSSRCCYDDQDALLPQEPWSVALLDGKSLVFRTDDVDLNSTYTACCNADYLDSGLTAFSLCLEFLDYRPPCTSDLYQKFGKCHILLFVRQIDCIKRLPEMSDVAQ